MFEDVRGPRTSRNRKSSEIEENYKSGHIGESESSQSRYFSDNPVPIAEVAVPLVRRLVESVDNARSNAEATRTALQKCVPCTGFEPNAAMLRLFAARDPAEMQNHIPEIFSEADGSTLLNFGKSLLSDRDTHSIELPLRRVDDGSVRLRVHGTPAGRNSDTVLLSATEVTGNETLREQLSLLSLLPETNPNMVFVLENGEDVVYMNPTARRWLRERGVTPLEGIRQLLPDLAVPADRSGARPTEGEAIPVEDNGRRYSTRVAQILGTNRYMITVADVTEEHRLRVERNVFEKAFETASNPMLITDEQWRIEYVNEAFSNYYGYSREEALGKTPRILNPGKEAYRDLGFEEDSYESLFSKMRTELAKAGHYEADVANVRADGTIGWIRAIVTRIDAVEDISTKYLGVHIDVDEMRRREEAARLDILQTIARVGELRDNETGQHMKRVGLYARRIAETLGFPAKYCYDIENYAPLHDVGKVGIADEILLAPRKLTKEEFDIIKRHTTLGHGILSDAPSMEMAAEIALGHHEKFDGKGYPYGLAGDAIPWSARIVALADVYDALRAKRPYKEPWNHRDTIREIVGLKERHFCPSVVDAFENIESEFEHISISYRDG